MDNEKERINGLIALIQSGDKFAFDEFYKLTSPKAYFIALKITQNKHDAEDILQESYIKALEKLDEIDVSQNVMSWFCRIVANKSKNLVKSKKPLVFEGEDENFFEEIPEDKAEFCPEESLNQEELRLEVMAAIDELTEEKRACIMMMYFGEMSVKEIVESIELPESTVKNRLYTARKDLKSKFEKNENVLYGAAIGGVLIWALQKTSVSASAAFIASAASAQILAGIGASAAYSAVTTASAAAAAATTATASGATTATATGTGIAAKAAALSVAQKVAVGIAAAAVVGGSTAGVVTVVKNNNQTETIAYVEEATTTPTQKAEEAINRLTSPVETSNESTTKFSFNITLPSRKPHTTTPRTTNPTTSPAIPETTTETETITTTAPETTVVTTTQPQTTQPTTLAQAKLIIEVTDFDDNVVDTLNLTVEAGTEMTWDYLITLVSENGYEAMAGIYGDGVGAVAQAGETYNFTAEL